ncbi:MAG: glucosaminidase domain-containing protein [Bacteroidales bacterium]|nr:glucosaminidase domain-containing protein [Bacteroidales bacterium]
MKITLLMLVLLSLLSNQVNGQKNSTREEYISAFSDLAMREMVRVGIPASITLAQGCLESNNGNSTLAVRGNNHFGIKCHDWTGKKIYHDDDRRKECFRSYPSAYESYKDHSQFLTTKSRYAPLFEISPHDYRGWAKGLKKAGYATAKNYATLLIRIIEENELYQFDLLVLDGSIGDDIDTTSYLADHGYQTQRAVLLNNQIEYILSESGDTPESLRAELGLYKNEIYRYNNLYKGAKLETGTKIYLQPKRRKAAPGNEIHRVEAGQTMYNISQIYGVKLKHLYRKNQMMEGEQPLESTEIYLRRKKREPLLKTEPTKEQYEEEEMQFRFEH